MPKMSYIDVDVTVRLRLPFNAAQSEEAVLNDLYARQHEFQDGIIIDRDWFDQANDGMVVNKENGDTISEYMDLLDDTCESVESSELLKITRAVVVGRGEMVVGEEEEE